MTPAMCLDFADILVTVPTGSFADYLYRYWRSPHRVEPEAVVREAAREMRDVLAAVEAIQANYEERHDN